MVYVSFCLAVDIKGTVHCRLVEYRVTQNQHDSEVLVI